MVSTDRVVGVLCEQLQAAAGLVQLGQQHHCIVVPLGVQTLPAGMLQGMERMPAPRDVGRQCCSTGARP